MASIQKRGKGSFLLVVEAGYDSKGKRLRKTKTIRIEDEKLLRTKKRLRDYLNMELAKFKMEVEAGEYISPQKKTLKDFVQDWESKYAAKELAEQTYDVYLSHLRNHILPYFGHMRLDQVQPIHVVNFLDQLQRKDGHKKELSIGTVQYIYRVLRNVFERATEWRIIKSNPVAEVKKPKGKTKTRDINVYDEAEVKKVFKAAQKEQFHWRIFISLALAAGLRRGELLGLEWKHINLENGTIEIKQVLGRGKNGRPILKSPKSVTSERLVSIPPSLVKELAAYKKQWYEQKEKIGELWKEKEHDFLFCNEDGTHFYPTTPTTWWKRFTKRAKVRYIRLHDLRHTSATLLINQGIHAKIISERLGHADIRITMDTYGHALRSADKEAAHTLDSFFSDSKKDN